MPPQALGAPTETDQRDGIVGLVGLLSFHTQLATGGREADSKLFKVWAVLRTTV